MTEEPLDMKRFLRVVRRGKRLVLLTALAGLLAGMAYAQLRPPMAISSALVLLPSSTSSNSTSTQTAAQAQATQDLIASSNPVLAEAGASVSPALNATEVRHQVTIKALSDDVLEVQARAGSPKEAEDLANSVANSYIQFVTSPSNSSDSGSVTALQEQSAKLTQEIQALQNEINTVTGRLATEGRSSSTFQQDSSLLGSLQNEQTEVSINLDNLNNQIVNSQASGHLIDGTVRILQKATAVQPKSGMRLPTYGLYGAVIGMLVGVIVVLARSRQDRRLHLRDEMASAIGVPVFGSISADRLKTTEAWKSFLSSYQPAPSDAWTLRRVLDEIGVGRVERPHIQVIAFDDDVAALSVGPQLALMAATAGTATTLFPRDVHALENLRAACAVLQGEAQNGLTLSLAEQSDEWPSTTELEVSMVAVDTRQPVIPTKDATTVLALSPGRATADSLARLSLAIVDASSLLAGILVVNPETGDNTSGSVTPRKISPRSAFGPERRKMAPSALAGGSE